MKMTNTIKLTAVALTATLGLAITAVAQDAAATLPPASTKTGVTYATDIKPILDASCVKCHNGADATKKPKARLALDTLAGILKGGRDGKVVLPGDSAKSVLVLSVAHAGSDPDSFMPKGKDAKKLTDDQIGLIRAWIDQGAN
jgi:hypothetical protein